MRLKIERDKKALLKKIFEKKTKNYNNKDRTKLMGQKLEIAF